MANDTSASGNDATAPAQRRDAGVARAGDAATPRFALTRLRAGNPASVWDRLSRERSRIALRACYCSVLDDSRMLDSRRAEPSPVAQFTASDGVAWSQ